MFCDFSFEPVARSAYSAYEADRATMNVSPTSKPASPLPRYHRPSTPLPCTVGDLAAQLNQQSLRVDPSYPTDQPSPPKECALDQHDEKSRRPTYSRVAASLLRMQRQSNSRLQCSASHVRDISALVRMIEDEEQCTISEAKSRTSSSSSTSSIESNSTIPEGHDEALTMDCDPPARELEALLGLQRWQSNERRDSCVRVTKAVRMRKRAGEHGVTKRRSS
ncbi:hypothetical protein NX059_009623 [Plenodomus lindquistii]|nr:hypothetical protein NX059_009623 [Plenodomus lindquistii]